MSAFTLDPYQCYKAELLRELRDFGLDHDSLADDAREIASMLACDEIGIDTAERRLAELEEIEMEIDRQPDFPNNQPIN